MEFLNAVQSVLTIIIMFVIGYVLTGLGWFDEKTSKVFSRIVVNLALPLYMVSNLMGTYNKEKLIHLASGLFVPFAVMGLSYVLSIIVSLIIKVPRQRLGTFRSMFAFSNTIFVGLPVNMALFGDESLPYVLLYYIANTTFFWTIGNYGISRDGTVDAGRMFSAANIRRIFSPPLMGFLISIILILLGVHLPKSIMDTCKYLGNLTTPLSMLFIGTIIYSVKIKDIKPDISMWVLLAGRFLAAPLIAIGLCTVYPAIPIIGQNMPTLMEKVFVIQASMPAMTQTSIIAESYGADYKYAAVMTTVTTIVSMMVIPIYMLVLGNI